MCVCDFKIYSKCYSCVHRTSITTLFNIDRWFIFHLLLFSIHNIHRFPTTTVAVHHYYHFLYRFAIYSIVAHAIKKFPSFSLFTFYAVLYFIFVCLCICVKNRWHAINEMKTVMCVNYYTHGYTGKANETGQFVVHFKTNRCRVNSFLFWDRVMHFVMWKVSIESFFLHL